MSLASRGDARTKTPSVPRTHLDNTGGVLTNTCALSGATPATVSTTTRRDDRLQYLPLCRLDRESSQKRVARDVREGFVHSSGALKLVTQYSGQVMSRETRVRWHA